MNTNIATLIMKNMAAAHRQLQNNMGDAFTTTLTSFRNYLKTTALWFVKSEDRWVEYGTCDVNGVTWTAEALFAYGYQEVMKVFKNADKAVFLQNISAAEVQTTAPTQMPFHPLQDDAMFNKQIYNLFAKHHINVTSITKQDGPWHMDKPWQIDTDRGSFLLNRVEGDYDNWGITPVTVAVQTEEEVEVETAPVQPAAVDFRTMVEGKTVKIRVNGKVYAGRVVGFKLDFPKVWVREIDTEIEFSRNAILRAVEGDRILEGGSETSVQPVETAPVATPVETAPVATPVETAPVATPVETKQSTNTHYYSPSKMVTNKKFDLEEAPGEFLAAVRDYFGEGAYRVKYVAPVITDIGKDYDGDDVFYQVLVVCISGDQFMMTKPKWQTNWQVMPFHGEIKVGNYLLDIPVETATQEFMPEEPVTEVLSLGVIEVRFSRSSALFPKCTRPDDIEAVILLLSEKNDDELSTTTLHFHGNTYSFVELPHQNNGFGTVLAVPYGSDHGRWVITLLRGKDGNYNLHQNDFLVHAEEMNHRHTESL